MPKKLIINADDFGLTESTNKGVIDCYTKGSVTDISLLACGDAFQNAIDLARENNINKTGVHLALTGPFRPLTFINDIPTLIAKDGKFPRSYSSFLIKYFLGRINLSQVEKEFRAQIEKVKKENIKITHIDSHQHIHIVPGILKIVLKLLKEEEIEYVRFPFEVFSIYEKVTDPRAWVRNILLSTMCRVSKNLLDKSGVKYNSYFIGHVRAHELCMTDLMIGISSLKEGITELGCHPGYLTKEIKINHPYCENCEEELTALCDKSFANEIKRRSIDLVSY